jgi:hypothetical protein
MKLVAVWVLALAAMAITPRASAQCLNTAAPSCGVYQSCFAKACPCKGDPAEYFVSYGKKYCEVFLDLPGLSPRGKAWRDSTLRCLQETIVPRLPPDGKQASCNCAQMQTFAFDSHVACYTKPGASICSLGPADWLKILGAVDPVKSMVDDKGRKQMLEVAKVCLPVVTGDVKAAVQRVVDRLK